MTTNCIIEPRPSYKARIFTTGEVGWSGVNHIPGKPGDKKDYGKVIAAALVSEALGGRGGGPGGAGAEARQEYFNRREAYAAAICVHACAHAPPAGFT